MAEINSIEEKKEEDPAEEFVKSITNLSDKRIELALKNRGLSDFDEIIENTKKEAMGLAKKEVEKQIDTAKKDMFTVFGIFTSFIAFIVGEINILKTIDSIYDKIGFSFLFVSFILGFLFGVMFLLNDKVSEDKFKKMMIVFAVFFGIGIFFILWPSIFKLFLGFLLMHKY
jgi:uncharacterized membrane protein